VRQEVWWLSRCGRGGGSLPAIAFHPTSLSVHGDEAYASTPASDLRPYSSQYEGYMGNEGNTLDRWYHRAAVAVWPRDQVLASATLPVAAM
jgi:hypothetical protein